MPIARLDAAPTSLPGSSLVITNVFGALAFKHWLERLSGPLVGGAVADGWGGDRWDIVDDGGVSVLVWRTSWDADDDAKEFAAAYAGAVGNRYGERAQKDEASTDDRVTFVVPAAAEEERYIRTKRDERVVIERRGSNVLIVEGTTPEATPAFVEEMWTKLTRAEYPPIDEARLAEKAKTLEEHIGNVDRAPKGLDLVSRLFLPARTMSVRLGAGAGLDERAPDGVDSVFLVNDTEMRWGFRPHLELSLPLALSAEARTFLGQTIGGVSVRGFLPSPTFTLQLSHAVPLGDTIALVAQGSIDDVGDVDESKRLAGGAMLRPFPQLVLAPAISRLDDPVTPTVIIGSALRRGTVPQPLAEVEVIEGLFVYESSAFFFDQRDKGLALRLHTHVLGLLLYF